jgi:hypothetical protein
MLTAERLRELVHYCQDTGVFTPRVNRGSAGGKAGNVAPSGYRRLHVDGRLHLEHRLAWLYMTGQWPARHIDHINRCRSDNRFANLRDVTQAENNRNRAPRRVR